MTPRDRTSFIQYLHQCTDRQVIGVLKRERLARRREYVMLAQAEAVRRGLPVLRSLGSNTS